MHDVLKALPGIAAQLKDERAFEAVISALWRTCVGDDLNKISRPKDLNEKVLTVAVASDSWETHLKALSAEIIYKLNAAFGMSVVKRLEFIVDRDQIR